MSVEKEIFDRSVYDCLVSELGNDDVAEVLQGFLTDTCDKLKRLSTLTLDRIESKREAHSIKSSSATFGFLELSRLARQLEAGADTMSVRELDEAISAICRSFEQVRLLPETILPRGARETTQ